MTRLLPPPKKGPKILLLDIETAPILAFIWNLWENNVSLNFMKKDWHVLSWAAKWINSPPEQVMYRDQRHRKNIDDDKELLRGIWRLLDQCDFVVTQNGDRFDIPKLNARFLLNGMQPPASYRQIDTKKIAKRKFGFTSNSLEYLADKLNKKYKKLKHERFHGFDLWKEILAGNKDAWQEMEKYNKHDVLAMEETYLILRPWDSSINFNVYDDVTTQVCSCGRSEFKKNGYYYTNSSRFQRFKCLGCGSEMRGRENLLSKDKKKSLLSALPR